MSDQTAVSPLAAVSTVTLPLTPIELGVVVALAGLGLSAMRGDVLNGQKYQTILSNDEIAPVAESAFAALVQALEVVP